MSEKVDQILETELSSRGQQLCREYVAAAGYVTTALFGIYQYLEEQGDSDGAEMVKRLLKPFANHEGRAKIAEIAEITLPDQIRDAYVSLTGGRKKRVHLKDLRPLVSASPQELDAALKEMQRYGQLVLFNLDNPAEITPEDERAALMIAGNPRHIVYFEEL